MRKQCLTTTDCWTQRTKPSWVPVKKASARRATWVGAPLVGAILAGVIAACAATPEVAVGTTQAALESASYDCAAAETESLQAYAEECQGAMDGVRIPAFNCDDGVEVPDTHPSGGNCDRPNVLMGQCDPGARFQVLVNRRTYDNKGDIQIVAHCRKQGSPDVRNADGTVTHQFQDIAIIAHNTATGATCFFQNTLVPMNQAVPSPADPAQTAWQSPEGVHGINCVRCHDNGPFIRDPYLSQLKETFLTSPNRPAGAQEDPVIVAAQAAARAKSPQAFLPGSRDFRANSTGLYRFVGRAFQDWRSHAISLVDDSGRQNECLGCHRMGISALVDDASQRVAWSDGFGTSLDFAKKATGDNNVQPSKNPHSVASPMWMLMDATRFDPAHRDAARTVTACATAVSKGEEATVPGCDAVEFAQGTSCNVSLRGTINGATASEPGYDPVRTVQEIPFGPDVGVIGWRKIHGPFVEASKNTPYRDAALDGSYLKIGLGDDRKFRIEAGWDGPRSPVQRAAPGGEWAGIYLKEFAQIADPTACFAQIQRLADLDGTIAAPRAGLPTTHFDVLWSFVGNVSLRPTDFYGFNNRDFYPGYGFIYVRNGTPAVFEGDAAFTGCPNWNAGLPRVRTSTKDELLVTAAEEVQYKYRCLISGVGGDWSATRDDAKTQPYAEIYTAPNRDIRLRVGPFDGADAVSATATCYPLRP